MKKTVSVLLSIAMTLTAFVPAFAADSDKMKESLASVKTRIEVPEEMSVFRSGIMNELDENTDYNFRWSDEQGDNSIYVNADSKGRITYYSRSCEEKERFGLANVTKAEAKEFADNMIKKAAPELFANSNDMLVYDESSSSAYANNGYSWFNFEYQRQHDGVAVNGNSASVSVRAFGNDMYVSDMSISWDYDTAFADEKAELENPGDKYFEAFPLELLYARMNSYEPMPLRAGEKKTPKVVMKYSFKDNTGYISAVDGKVVEPYSEYQNARKNAFSGAAMGSAAMTEDAAADNGVHFSEEELSELERVENLISADKAEQILRNVTVLKINPNLKRSSARIYRQRKWDADDKNDINNEKFVMSITLSDENSSVYASLDAKTGEILSIRNYAYDKTAQKIKGDADSSIKLLLLQVCKDKSLECETAEDDDTENYLIGNRRRVVNGIPYGGNYIRYSFDKQTDRITSYSLEWDDDTSGFTSPDKAIGMDKAQTAVLGISPLKLVYLKTNDGFRLCYTISDSRYYTDIDAVTGEQLVKKTDDSFAATDYTDIGGHWAETAIQRLAEVGVFEPGDKFRPDDKITQAEMLRMFAGALNGRWYHDTDEEELYRMLEREGYVKDGEKNPEAAVMRENMFVYMVRFMGYERVAKLKGIYSCNYADSAQISEDKLGFAAILTGFGVVSGDVESIRAKDNATRAEAAMMLYKYLTHID